jgi:nitroimidazol reductase NimA-like FMN-containing flavoprotein (pyridoxamine 5'-phosphate oxidase superfamily)
MTRESGGNMSFKVSNFKHVAEGLQEGQFTVGERSELERLEDLDPRYRQLLDDPVTAVLAVMAGDGRTSLTPVWIGYRDDRVLFNFSEHRKKCEWIESNPQVTAMLMNPANPYHWMSIKATMVERVHEDGPDGERATATIDEAWAKYTGNEPPYGLRDPVRDERRVLYECSVDSVATFGLP